MEKSLSPSLLLLTGLMLLCEEVDGQPSRLCFANKLPSSVDLVGTRYEHKQFFDADANKNPRKYYFNCAPGFSPSASRGPVPVSCIIKDGGSAWTVPMCKKITCKFPPHADNYNIEIIGGGLEGSEAHYSCKHKVCSYNGTTPRICTEDGWSGKEGSCRCQMGCPPVTLPLPDGMVVKITGSVIENEYSCVNGFIHKQGHGMCDVGYCIRTDDILCSLWDVGNTTMPNNGTLHYNESYVPTCAPGHRNTEGVLICSADGTLVSGSEVCVPEVATSSEAPSDLPPSKVLPDHPSSELPPLLTSDTSLVETECQSRPNEAGNTSDVQWYILTLIAGMVINFLAMFGLTRCLPTRVVDKIVRLFCGPRKERSNDHDELTSITVDQHRNTTSYHSSMEAATPLLNQGQDFSSDENTDVFSSEENGDATHCDSGIMNKSESTPLLDDEDATPSETQKLAESPLNHVPEERCETTTQQVDSDKHGDTSSSQEIVAQEQSQLECPTNQELLKTNAAAQCDSGKMNNVESIRLLHDEDTASSAANLIPSKDSETQKLAKSPLNHLPEERCATPTHEVGSDAKHSDTSSSWEFAHAQSQPEGLTGNELLITTNTAEMKLTPSNMVAIQDVKECEHGERSPSLKVTDVLPIDTIEQPHVHRPNQDVEDLLEASSTFIAYEASFSLQPLPGKSLQQEVDRPSHSEMAVLVCHDAAGDVVLNPTIAYKGTSYDYDPLEGFLEASFRLSSIGRIDAVLFKSWLETIFLPHIRGLKKPIFLKVDKPELYMSSEAAEICFQNNVVLSDMLQVHCFKLYEAWKEAVDDYTSENPGTVFTPQTFAAVFKNAWTEWATKENICDGVKLSRIRCPSFTSGSSSSLDGGRTSSAACGTTDAPPPYQPISPS